MSDGDVSASAPVGSPPDRLRRRPDFLHVGRGCRVHLAAFTVQAAQRRPAPPNGISRSSPKDSVLLLAKATQTSVGEPTDVRLGAAAADLSPACRFGFTVTKKVGGAVERNRIRRRLRAALRQAKALSTQPETDYVVVARRDVLTLPFERLITDLQTAIRKVGVQMTKPAPSGRDVRRRGKL